MPTANGRRRIPLPSGRVRYLCVTVYDKYTCIHTRTHTHVRTCDVRVTGSVSVRYTHTCVCNTSGTMLNYSAYQHTHTILYAEPNDITLDAYPRNVINTYQSPPLALVSKSLK